MPAPQTLRLSSTPAITATTGFTQVTFTAGTEKVAEVQEPGQKEAVRAKEAVGGISKPITKSGNKQTLGV